MRLRFLSTQLMIEEGEVALVGRLGALKGRQSLSPTRIVSDEVLEIEIQEPGHLRLVLTNCIVRFLKGGLTRRIPVFHLTVVISQSEIEAGVAEVDVGPLACVRLEAVDSKDMPLRRDHAIGVSLDWMSIEAKGPEHSPLEVLLPPGTYTAYIADPDANGVQFTVRAGDEDFRTISVRERSSRSSSG
jgi:hypothetical protein